MSLDGIRDAVLKEKKNEITSSLLTRKRKLRELYKHTAHCAGALNAGYQPKFDDLQYHEPDEKESRFLDDNDISKGRHFNDATLPFIHHCDQTPQQSTLPTTLPFQKSLKNSSAIFSPSSPSPVVEAPSLEDQLRAASASPSVANHPDFADRALVQSAATTNGTHARGGALKVAGVGMDESSRDDAPAAVQPLNLPNAGQKKQKILFSERPTLDLQSVAPATVEDTDAAAFPDTDRPTLGADSKQKPPQVVHLPPKEVQEARLQETERKLDKAAEKERREEEKLATAPPVNGSVDVSSPSSTVGPYSQATPHAPHHSPDTSPDTDSYRDRNHIPLPHDDILDPAAQQVKEDHERALQKRMDEAREQARARDEDSPTPDIEQQLESEQAIRLARDGKSLDDSQTDKAARSMTYETAAMLRSTRDEVNTKAEQDPAAESLPTPTTTAPESTMDRDDQPDTKPVVHDHPTPPADADISMDDAPEAKTHAIASPQSPKRSDRMTTRVASGAIRQKSVSEIIADKSSSRNMLTPHSSNLETSVSPPRPRSGDPRSRAVSTVVFAKKTPTKSSKALHSYNEDYASLEGASQDSNRDYLEGLFKYQAHHHPRSVPLQELVSSARKTVSTAATLAMIRSHQDYKILKRVYQLQNANRWSLRQLQKAVEPERPFGHQDYLLLDMKWMQTDFKEERKWKKSLAATFAQWCEEYVHSSSEDQAMLRVNSYIPKRAIRTTDEDEDMHDAPTPDLEHAGVGETESESYADDDELLSPSNANAPTGLFSLGFNDVVMKIQRTPASDQLFRELPYYEPTLEGASDSNPFSVTQPPILPVSKFVTGKLVSQIRGPPKKRSRYDYDSEDEPSSPPSRSGTSAEHSMPSTPGRRLFCRNDLPPEMTDVALFNAENKHVRDRLQAAHQFRPPTEFNMPSVAFFENRTPSQWLWEEDQKLRALVKEYTFNWSLVSQQLSLPSLFVSGSGRRTPWECFERWVQLEGLPAEMSKTQYFRTYQGRLEQANKTVYAQFQAQQQQQQGQTSGQARRRPTTIPIRVERRRENRHLAIIDGMRKLARKRESAAHKQAESQKAAALRKAHEPTKPANNIHTPQEFSRLKWEREEKLKQRQMQQEMIVRQQMAAQRQAQMQGQAGMVNGVGQMQRIGTPGNNINVPTQMANMAAQQGQNGHQMSRSHQGQQGMQTNFGNSNMGGMSMSTPGVPQAQMQGNMQNAQRMGPPDQMRMAMQRGQFQNASQQHQFQLQQQQINMASNLAQGMGMNGIPNANMVASAANQNMNGNLNGGLANNMSTNMNGMPNNAGSPRMHQVNPNMQTPARPVSSGQHMATLVQLQQNLRNSHPDWTDAKIQQAASEHLQRSFAKQRSQAVSAAAGPSGMSPSPQVGNNHFHQQNGGMANSPQPNAVQNYQQQLVQQQRLMSQQRPQAGSPPINGRPPSRSATPQNPQMQQSPGIQQAQINRA